MFVSSSNFDLVVVVRSGNDCSMFAVVDGCVFRFVAIQVLTIVHDPVDLGMWACCCSPLVVVVRIVLYGCYGFIDVAVSSRLWPRLFSGKLVKRVFIRTGVDAGAHCPCYSTCRCEKDGVSWR